MVVSTLPASERFSGRLEVLEALSPPELVLIDPMTPLDFAVLLRAPGPNVSVGIPAASTSSRLTRSVLGHRLGRLERLVWATDLQST